MKRDPSNRGADIPVCPADKNVCPTTDRDERLNQVLAAYLEAVEAGRAPRREDVMARYPDLAPDLAEFFANQDCLRPVAEPFRSAPAAGARSPDRGATGGNATPLSATQAYDASLVGEDAAGSAAPAGSTFGSYEILAEIARGGMGVVYRARHLQLNRVVALKQVLAGESAGAAALRRFRMEAEAAANLDHPHIVPIYEVGEQDGQPYFTMKLIDGGGLDQQINRFIQDQPAAARLLASVARAVHHAHQRGILHRDLKPGNILLDVEGEPHITDFGLAKRLTELTGASAKPNVTRLGTIIGTACYMAPEQALAKNDDLTTAADVYGLGAILFELLTGRPPFRAETFMDTLIEVVERTPPRPRDLNPQVDADLELICLKCLSKDPVQRYGSAAELAEELEHWRAGESLRVRPAGRVERLRKWCRKNRGLAALGTGLMLCLLIVAVGSPVAALLIDTERRQTARTASQLDLQKQELEQTNGKLQTSLDSETHARQETDTERKKYRQLLVRRYVNDGNRLLEAGDWFGSLVWFTEALELDREDRDRAEMHRLRIGLVQQRCPRMLQVWFPESVVADAAFSPDGQRLCTLGQDGTARMRVIGKEKPVFQFGEGIRKGAFSQDGTRLLAVHVDGKARLWDTGTGKLVHELAAPRVTCAAFSPGDAWVVTGGEDGIARAWDLLNLRQPPRQTPPGSALRFVAVDARGRLIAATYEKKPEPETVWWLWQEKARARMAGYGEIKRTTASLHAVAFGPGSNPILTVNVNGIHRAHCWTLTGRSLERKTVIEHRSRADLDLCFNPQKGLILTVDGPAAQACDVMSGKPVGPRFTHASDVAYAIYSPDHKRVLTGSGDLTARVWDAETGQPLTPPLVREATAIRRARFSADGRRVFLVSGNAKGAQTVQVLEIAAPESGYQKTGSKPWEPRALFSPDGRLALALSADRKSVQLWDTASARSLAAPLAYGGRVIPAVFSRDSRRLLTGDSSTLHIWEGRESLAPRPSPLAPLPVRPGGELKQAVFTADGSQVMTMSRREEQLVVESWDAATGKPAAAKVTIKRPGAPRLEVLSSDGRLLALALVIGTRLELVDAATGKDVLRTPLEHNAKVTLAAFSPNSRRLVTACTDRTAQVWDTASGEVVGALLPLPGSVLGASFDRDGRLLATVHAREGSGDKDGVTVRVWDTATWQPLTPLLLHDKVQSAAFSSDGRSLITTASDDSARIWELRPTAWPSGDLKELAEVMAGRRLHPNGYLMPRVVPLRESWPLLRKLQANAGRPTP